MKALILSIRSEFYKSRKTAGFWSVVILPLFLCLVLFINFLSNNNAVGTPSMLLWIQFAGTIFGAMGTLLLPMLVVFTAYSVNNIEHKSDTWKTLFSLPISKFSIYAAKYIYAMFIILICLMLFVPFTVGFGNLLGLLKPQLNFGDYSMINILLKMYFKLFLSSLGILSIQFILSLLFRDFLKPMGIGFVATMAGVILASDHLVYAYLFPYAQQMLAASEMPQPHGQHLAGGSLPAITIELFTKEIYASLITASVIFFAGYFIVLKKSVK